MSEIGVCISRWGHKFQPRYTVGAPTLGEDILGWIYGSQRPEALKDSRPTTYVCDVCVRCGAIASRSALPPHPSNNEKAA